jgi:hypothetical protein
MKVTIGIVLALITAGTATQIRQTSQGWVLVAQPLKWESPPPEAGLKIKTAPAEIIVLYPSGDFGAVFGLLIRQRDGSIQLCNGDGHIVSIGKWKRDGDTIRITFRVVYADVLTRGVPIPGPETIRKLTATNEMGNWRSDDEGKVFKHLANFRSQDFLSVVINCDRTNWDGQTSRPIDGPCASATR